jgi:hypothetical protein
MKIYNVLGTEIGTVLNAEALDEGIQEIDFEAGSLPTGIYFYRIVASTFDDETGEPARPAGNEKDDASEISMKRKVVAGGDASMREVAGL